ncbi:MAG: polyamine aminopropyltransferase [Candidatus Omnitrophica bacterium]|nr:polyamine aminopropyltransferase [Candidatus Omnitrophota bacterium]
MWYYEKLFSDVKLGLEGKIIYKKKSPYQNIVIYQTPLLGRILFLDDTIQTTEKDNFVYHEMLTHPLLLSHPSPNKILVIGAGDGGVLREVLKHDVEKVYLVEIDREVIEVSKKYLKSICGNSFNDKRAEIIIEDGAKFVQNKEENFDIVIVDSPDPMGVAKVLFSQKFYQDIFSLLNEDGMMIRQTGSSILQPKELRENYNRLKRIFPKVIPMVAACPTYIIGFFTFLIACKGRTPIDISSQDLNRKYEEKKLRTKYYNPEIHFASFSLPNYIKGGIEE